MRLPKLAVILFLCLGVTACNPFADSGGLEDMTLEPLGSSRVFVDRGESRLEVTDRFALEIGDVVSTRDTGAQLQLNENRRAWLAPSSSVRIAGEARLVHVEGSLLAQVDAALVVELEDVEVSSNNGRIRIDQESAFAAAMPYGGSLTITAPGREPVKVEPLFQVQIAPGELLPAKPYEPDDADDWDADYLGGVLELEERLHRVATALSGQLNDPVRNETLLDPVLSPGNKSAISTDIESQSASDLLIAAGIAKADATRSFEAAFQRAFDLRDEGGRWGIVVAIMEVDENTLLAALEDLVAESGILSSGSPERGGPSPSGASTEALDPCVNVIDCLLETTPARGSGLP
jgi:hypothetical protein